MKVMSSLPEHTIDLSLEDFRLNRFFIIFMADIKTDEGDVVEEDEEFDEADDINEEVDGDNLDALLLLVDTSSLDLVLSDLRPFRRSNLFIGPDLLVLLLAALGSSSI